MVLDVVLASEGHVTRVVMRWLIFPLTIQTMVGIALTFRPFSLNKWEPNEGVHRSGNWLALVTGIIFLSSAGLSWYGYTHNRSWWCWGLTGLPLLKFCLDVIGLVLLYFVLFRTKSASTSETNDGNGTPFSETE